MKLSYLSLAVVVLIAVVLMVALLGSRPKPLGVRAGQLLPCPDSPNCVSSFEAGEHGVTAIAYRSTPAEALGVVTQVMAAWPRTTLLSRENNYLRFAVRSARLGFVDDVEFLATENLLQFRSASRLGYVRRLGRQPSAYDRAQSSLAGTPRAVKSQ